MAWDTHNALGYITISAIKLPPNQKRQWMAGKKIKGSWPGTHTMHSVTLLSLPFFQSGPLLCLLSNPNVPHIIVLHFMSASVLQAYRFLIFNSINKIY